MRGTREFSAYGDFCDQVAALVEDDVGAQAFFEALPGVTHVPTLDQAHQCPGRLVVCTVQLYDRETRARDDHCVALLREGNQTYFYDPNGVIHACHASRYLFRGRYLGTSKDLAQRFQWKVPQWRGIQDTNKVVRRSPYVADNGYCMFYVWWALHYIVTQEGVPMESLYRTLTKPALYPLVFPPGASPYRVARGTARKGTVEGDSVALIQTIYKRKDCNVANE